MTYEHIQLDPRRPRRDAEAEPPGGAQCDDARDGRRGARAPSTRSAPTRDVRVLVVTGAGKAFSGGGDLGMLARDAGVERRATRRHGRPAARLLQALPRRSATLPIPTIAAINGHAIGAGLCFALACDLRIAAADAKMGMTFTKLGIHPGMGATYFLPRLIGTARACELLFTGRIIDAAEAERLGIVNRVVAARGASRPPSRPRRARSPAPPRSPCAWSSARSTAASSTRSTTRSTSNRCSSARPSRPRTRAKASRAIMEKREPRFTGGNRDGALERSAL